MLIEITRARALYWSRIRRGVWPTSRLTPAMPRIRVIVPTAARLTAAFRQKLCQAELSAKARCRQSLMVSTGPVVPDHLPVVDRNHAAAQQVDDVTVVSRHQDRGLGLVVDLEEELHDLPAGRRVEVPGRLVGHDQAWLVDQCAGDGDALLFATGKLAGVLVELPGQPHRLQRLAAPHPDDRARLALDAERERHVLVDGELGQQLEVLEDQADLAPVVRQVAPLHASQLLAVHQDLALGGLILPDQQADQARLAGARGADQKEEVTLRHHERDVAQGFGAVRVLLPDVLEADERPGWGEISLQNHKFDVEKTVWDLNPLASGSIASGWGTVKSRLSQLC